MNTIASLLNQAPMTIITRLSEAHPAPDVPTSAITTPTSPTAQFQAQAQGASNSHVQSSSSATHGHGQMNPPQASTSIPQKQYVQSQINLPGPVPLISTSSTATAMAGTTKQNPYYVPATNPAVSNPSLTLYTKRLSMQTEALSTLLQNAVAEIKRREDELGELLRRSCESVLSLEGRVGEVGRVVAGEVEQTITQLRSILATTNSVLLAIDGKLLQMDVGSSGIERRLERLEEGVKRGFERADRAEEKNEKVVGNVEGILKRVEKMMGELNRNFVSALKDGQVAESDDNGEEEMKIDVKAFKRYVMKKRKGGDHVEKGKGKEGEELGGYSFSSTSTQELDKSSRSMSSNEEDKINAKIFARFIKRQRSKAGVAAIMKENSSERAIGENPLAPISSQRLNKRPKLASIPEEEENIDENAFGKYMLRKRNGGHVAENRKAKDKEGVMGGNPVASTSAQRQDKRPRLMSDSEALEVQYEELEGFMANEFEDVDEEVQMFNDEHNKGDRSAGGTEDGMRVVRDSQEAGERSEEAEVPAQGGQDGNAAELPRGTKRRVLMSSQDLEQMDDDGEYMWWF
ncbi:hypothetical protein DFH27DRAFT_615209 [Peziza echinospora]|nr:hypothetical protein DFH27DRAFT_615209 [Peziza echinospora]